MKNIFKFAAMAFAAVVMFASCDKKDDKTPATVSIDGKQWVFELSGTGVFLDFGLKKDGILCSGYCDPTTLESMMGQSLGAYTITATDATSGTINVEAVDPATGEPTTYAYKYMSLSEKSVKIDINLVYGQAPAEEVTFADFNLVEGTIEFEDMYDAM